jgi:hypothetical protein
MSGVELAAAGSRAALDDCGADVAKVAATIDTVAGVRQFEISGPAKPVLGKSNNYPRSVANRIGADPARAILEVVGGQGPQHLITELAGEIAAGRSEVALIFGSDATSTTRCFAATDNRPDFSETVDGSLEDRGHGLDRLVTRIWSSTVWSMRRHSTRCWRMPVAPKPGWAQRNICGGWASCSRRSPRSPPAIRLPPRRWNAASTS